MPSMGPRGVSPVRPHPLQSTEKFWGGKGLKSGGLLGVQSPLFPQPPLPGFPANPPLFDLSQGGEDLGGGGRLQVFRRLLTDPPLGNRPKKMGFHLASAEFSNHFSGPPDSVL